MKYEIIYLSKSGNTAKVARAIASRYPQTQCRIVDFAKEEPSLDADIYLIGFGVNRGTCPFSLLSFLRKLEGKTIILFGTGAISAASQITKQIEYAILPFLPEHCAYKGICIVPGSFSKAGMDYLCTALQVQNDSVKEQQLYNLYAAAAHRPDQMDYETVLSYIQSALA